MSLHNLEAKLKSLAVAVAQFEEACHQEYHRLRLNQAKSTARLALHTEIKQITRLGVYSTAQIRAITGAYSAWSPTVPKPIRSQPLTNRSRG